MKKILFPSLIALGLMACSDGNDPVVGSQQQPTAGEQESVVAYVKNDGLSLWKHMDNDGTKFFEDHGILPQDLSTPKNVTCKDGLRLDANTIFFDELEGLYMEGSLEKGVCGKALNLKSGEVAPLSINMIFPLEKGTVEFWFKPNKDFYDKPARTLLGNDEARIHFFVQDNKIVFQKNHADKHFFVKGDVTLSEDWNHIAGQWDGEAMTIWVNGKMVGKKSHPYGYEASMRSNPFGNLLVMGYKSSCCMEGPGQYRALTTSGAYDQIRISNIPRYNAPEETIVTPDTVVVDTSSIDTVIVESSSSDSIVLFEDFDNKDVNYSIELTEGGISGKAGSFGYGDMLVLDALDKEIPQGTFQFYFKPNAKFFTEKNAALVGSDEGRLTIQKSGNRFYFFKNLPDNKIYVSGEAELVDGWNKFAGQWDGKSMSLYINDSLIATRLTNTAYTPSTRGSTMAPYGNAILVGYKDYCCTTGDDVYAYGEFDDIMVIEKLMYVNQKTSEE